VAVYNFNLRLAPETPPVPGTRRYRPGHYLAIGNGNQSARDNYTGNLSLPGLQGVQFRYEWKSLEPSLNNFTAQPILDDLTKIASVTTSRGKKDSQLIAMIEDKSFANQGNPLPAYLVPYSSPNSNGGYTSWRWDPYVVERFLALVNFLGPIVDQNPNFAGFAIQETAMGFGGAPGHGYTDLLMRNALRDQCLGMADATPHAVAYWYQNFMPSNATDFRIDEVADLVKGKGVIFGGPDILPDEKENIGTALEDRVYPRYRNPPDGVFGEMPLFCSCQQESYRHKHVTTSPPDTRAPGFTWNIGDYWRMEELFLWSTGTHSTSLHLQTVVWENVLTSNAGAGQPPGRTVADSKAVWAKYPSWTIAGADNTP
jgi:hypothetical protein